MSEPTSKYSSPAPAGSPRTVLGRGVVAQGQVISDEDVLIEGQFDGNISLDDHCLTIGPEGRVKAEIRARQIIIQGMVAGNIVAREKVDIRRTGQVIGDIAAASVAIEDGAYLKGSIDITRKETAGTPGGVTPGK